MTSDSSPKIQDPRAKTVPGTERRVHPRIEFKVRVSMVGPSNFYLGLSENISEGGLFIATACELPLGTEIAIEFTIPTASHAIRATAKVRWHRTARAVAREQDVFGTDSLVHPGVGVQLTDIAPSDLEAIQRFIHYRAPDFMET